MKKLLYIFLLSMWATAAFALTLSDTDIRGPGYIEDGKTTFAAKVVHNAIYGNSNHEICIIDDDATTTGDPTWTTSYAVPGLSGVYKGTIFECVEGLDVETGGTISGHYVTPGSSKIILLEISGDITSATPTTLTINHDKTQIVGQSGPAPGIQLENITLRISADYIAVEHIRVRLSDNSGGTSCDARDALSIFKDNTSLTYIVGNHLSGQFSTDELVDTYTGSGLQTKYIDITYSIFSDAIDDNDWCGGDPIANFSENHSKGIQCNRETDDVNYTGNLVVRVKDRIPLVYGDGCFFANNAFMGVSGLDSWGPQLRFYDPENTDKDLTYVGQVFKKGSWNQNYALLFLDSYYGGSYDDWDTSITSIFFDSNTTYGCSSTYAVECADYDTTNFVSDLGDVLGETPDPKVSWANALKPTGFSYDTFDEIAGNVAGSNEKWKVPGAWPAYADSIDSQAKTDWSNDTGGSAPNDESWINLTSNSFTHSLPNDPFTVNSASGYTYLEEWYHVGGVNATHDWGTSKAEGRSISFQSEGEAAITGLDLY